MPTLVVKTKFFTASEIKPKTPTPDGTSLEEQMNVFLASISEANFRTAEVLTYVKTSGPTQVQLCGMVTYLG